MQMQRARLIIIMIAALLMLWLTAVGTLRILAGPPVTTAMGFGGGTITMDILTTTLRIEGDVVSITQVFDGGMGGGGDMIRQITAVMTEQTWASIPIGPPVTTTSTFSQ